MCKRFGRLGTLRGIKQHIVVPTNKSLNVYALKCYIASFNIFGYKRDITSENGIRYYETPSSIITTKVVW